MTNRREIVTLAAALPLVAAAGSARAAVPRQVVLETWTLLKSVAPQPDELVAFLEANWLAIDRMAIAGGVFGYAKVLATGGQDWNAAMVVGYFTPGGYSDVRAGFEAVRARHREVRPHGKPLKDLGRIVGSRQMRLVASAP